MAHQFRRLVAAIRNGDETMVENAVLALSQRSRWLAPLALVVGAFAMLFQGLKLLVTNWRLVLVEILPAMWIWAAMLDLKLHVFKGKAFRVMARAPADPHPAGHRGHHRRQLLLQRGIRLRHRQTRAPPDPGGLRAGPGAPLRPILRTGASLIGLALGFSAFVVDRWGKAWFGLSLGIVVGIMMLAYVAVPARLVGIKSETGRSGTSWPPPPSVAASVPWSARLRTRWAGWPSSCSAPTPSGTWR